MSRLLENDHNVLILGSGFSRDAGLPMINDFLVRMRDSHEWLERKGRHREAEAIDEVLKFRLQSAAAAYWVNLDLENIEELFSLASASAGNIADQIRLAIAATLDHGSKTKGQVQCEIQVRHSSGLFDAKQGEWPDWVEPAEVSMLQSGCGSYRLGLYAWAVARLLGMLNDGKPQGKNTFITFNYDTVLEEALAALHLPVTYGSQLRLYPAKGMRSAQHPGLPILVSKLHGSLNWTHIENKNSLKVFRDYDQLAKRDLLPELVPPTWNKIFGRVLQAVWEDAIERLTTATRIVVIGSSMPPTDMHFKYLLAAGLRSNLSLRQVVFVNPDASKEFELRARKLFREAYVDSGRIAFAKTNLYGFACVRDSFDGSVSLSSIGRPSEPTLQYDYFLKP